MSKKVVLDFTAQEELDMNKLADEMKRVEMFKGFIAQYLVDFKNKKKKMDILIDDNIDRMIIALNERRKHLKQSLNDLEKNKKNQIDAEKKSLTKYYKILKQKASVVSSLLNTAKKKNMDKSEREKAITNIINSDVDPAFKIYQDEFDIVSHFQSIVTRPAVSFGEYMMDRDDNKSNNNNNNPQKVLVNPTMNSIKKYGDVSEQTMNEFSKFIQELPTEIIQQQELHKVVKNKVMMAQTVFDHAKSNVTNLRMKNLNDLYNMKTNNNVSEEIVLVFEAIYVILNIVSANEWSGWYKNFQNTKKRKQRWSKLKNILIEPTFIPRIFNFDPNNLTNKQLNILNNTFVAHSLFKYEIISKKNKSCGQLVHWIVSLVRLTNFKNQLNSINADLQTQATNLQKDRNKKKLDLQKKQQMLKKHQNK